MDIAERDFLLSIYKTQTLPFWYYRDKYAVQLLDYFLKDSMKMSELKAGPHQNLLQKKPLKEITSRLSNNQLSKTDLANYIPKEWLNFNMTFTHWGTISKYHNDNWAQTTLPGFSFVVQLNFDSIHDTLFHKLIKPIAGEDPLFKYTSHPNSDKKYQLTMAWARLDFDLTTGEVLIEEIQSDWFKSFDAIYQGLIDRKFKDERENISASWVAHYATTSIFKLRQYKSFLSIYKKIWAEAIMSAAIDFCTKELGLRDIYMHTYESGCVLKDCSPPKSLYTKVPKKFGFKLTKTAPTFIRRHKKIKKRIRKAGYSWWRLLL